MLNWLSNFTNLQPEQLLIAFCIVFVAGLARGFSGFALSAIIMAGLSTIIAPIELIPICFGVEILASFMMGRDGVKNTDWTIVRGLVIGTMVGVPIGLLVLTNIDPELSKLLTLIVIFFLSLLLLFKVRAQFLASRPGPYVSGVAAGIATGISGVGGLVVALYILAREKLAKEMRGTMVTFLMISEISTAVYYIIYQLFTLDVGRRVLVLAPLVILGIWLGTKLFNPRFAPYYKPVCLLILVGLCAIGLVRTILA